MRFSYLLATNVLYEPLKPRPNSGLLDWFRKHSGEAVTAAPVWHELRVGCHRLPPSARRRKLEQYLDEVLEPSLPVLPYDAEAAEWHAAERERLTRTGLTPPFVDGQIAVIAVVSRLKLVALDRSHFKPFHGLELEALGAR